MVDAEHKVQMPRRIEFCLVHKTLGITPAMAAGVAPLSLMPLNFKLRHSPQPTASGGGFP
jgi:hypothetical protein